MHRLLHAMGMFAVLLTLSLFVAPQAQAAPMEMAVQDDAALVWQRYGSREQWLDRAQSLNATAIRVNLSWSRIMPHDQAVNRLKPPSVSYAFAAYDDLIDAAAARGMRVQMTLMGPAPAWATQNKRVGNHLPNPAEYALFAQTVAQHFDGRVSRFSIWNEPNWRTQITPVKTAPEHYGKMYAAASNAIWRVRRTNQVWFGELSPYGSRNSIAPTAFITRATRARALTADGIAQHPYDFTQNPALRNRDKTAFTTGNLSVMKRWLAHQRRLKHRGGGKMPIWLTEFGTFARGSRALKSSLRTKYLIGGFTAAQRAGVRQMTHYQLVNPPKNENWDTGLLSSSNRASSAFRSLLSWTNRAMKSRHLVRPATISIPSRRIGL